MSRIGVQAMMLKEEFASLGPFETLRAVRGIGYRSVELSQIAMTPDNVAEIGRARAELGVEVAAVSATLEPLPRSVADSLSEDFEKIVSDANALGTSLVRIGWVPNEAMNSLEAVEDFSAKIAVAATRLADNGLKLLYHNHVLEFVKRGGRYFLDVMLDRAPDLGLEIDVHWVQRAGLDPVATLLAYGERVSLIHLKDFRIGTLPDSAFAKLAEGDAAGYKFDFLNLVQFAEIGEGNLNFPTIIAASEQTAASHLLVEQDELYGRSALECLAISYDNLLRLGYADLF